MLPSFFSPFRPAKNVRPSAYSLMTPEEQKVSSMAAHWLFGNWNVANLRHAAGFFERQGRMETGAALRAVADRAEAAGI